MRNHCYFLFLRVLRCFSSPGSPTGCCRCGGIAPAGFPHSDIRGSQGICPSPRLFAACHVLLRLREPQASPMRPFFLSLFLQARRNATTQGGAPLPYTKRPPSFRMTICSLYVARSRVLTPLLAARTRSLAAAQGRRKETRQHGWRGTGPLDLYRFVLETRLRQQQHALQGGVFAFPTCQ